ncbi:MAG: hypothetical protein FJ095_07620 [Deltaproteobacteria bacterium]|nr:hypothetical protein [Deltaproteobacteria bacterium]
MHSLAHLGPVALLSLLVACGGDDSSDTSGGPPPPELLPADGVTIERVAMYQGLERDLAEGGSPVFDGVRVIAGRAAAVRVFYQTDADYDGGSVLARLTVLDGSDAGGGGGAGAPATEKTFDIAGPLQVAGSKPDDLESTVVFDVPGEYLTPTSQFRVELLRVKAQTSGTNTKASYPTQGDAAIGAVSVGPRVRIVLVPIRYDADGSGRLPDTSPEQLALYRDVLYKLFPTPEVDLRVAEPFPWGGAVSGQGAGWGELLTAMLTHRQKSKAEYDEYYYGIFRARETFPQFCGGGCIAGLSQVALKATNDFARVGVGIGFSGPDIAMTAAHEIGHEHGRGHAPCGTNQGVDGGYPHADAEIGVYGFDLVTKQLQKPSMKDFMSYCDPKWVSDFTFEALATRMLEVNGAARLVHPGGEPKRKSYQRVSLGPDGSARWVEPLELERAPLGEPEVVRITTSSGEQEVVGHFFPYSHLPGGTLFFEAPADAARAVVRGRQVAR